MSTATLPISDDDWLDVQNLAHGVFAPLTGFMTGDAYRSVLRDMRLCDGAPFPIPVTLAVPDEHLAQVRSARTLRLVRESTGVPVAALDVHDLFTVDYDTDIKPVFRVTSLEHPGVRKEVGRPRHRVGGPVTLTVAEQQPCAPHVYTPATTRALFAERGWKRVTGFQTRNPIHRAHEHLQRTALEVTDGLFVQPLVGWKTRGDFTADAVIAAYEAMAEGFYPAGRVLIGKLMTQMRYAGPREAVFHAIIRRNYGCSHFIVGRDHAGVGNYYGKYDSQNLCLEFGSELGIEILALGGPFFCHRCLTPATDYSCGHAESERMEISGTLIRKMLSAGQRPPLEMMRAEIADVLIALQSRERLFY